MIPYEKVSESFNYEKAIRESLKSVEGKCMCILTNHPYRAAWVRLVRRVVMNAYVNQTGLLPFEYDSDEEDFKERFLLRSPTQHAKRKKRKDFCNLCNDISKRNFCVIISSLSHTKI